MDKAHLLPKGSGEFRFLRDHTTMPEKIKVLIGDKMDPKAAAIFRDRGIHVDEKPGLSPDELKAIIG